MASEPYRAAARPRRISAWRFAMEAMTEMSGPCEPAAMPLPSQVADGDAVAAIAVDDDEWVVGCDVRRFAGRTMVAASLMGWMLTLNEGTTVRN